MSIKTTTDIEVSLDTTEVTPTNTKDIVTDNQHCVEIENNESIIEGSKQEYSIVGDGLYASISADEAPQWLVDIVDNVVSTSMLNSFDNYNDLVQEVRNAIDSIDIAANTYVEQVNIQSLVDGIIASRLATLNATVDNNTATILDLDTAFVNLDESFAQRVLDITASFNETTDARITQVSQARADGDEALAQQITALDASIQDTNSDVSGQASAITGLQTYVGLDGSSDPNGTGVLSRVSILEKQNDGVIEYTTGTYDVMIGVDVGDDTPNNNQLDTSQAPYSTWIAADTAAGTEETRSAHVGDVYIQYSDDGNGNRTYIKSYKFIKTVVDETSPYSTDADGYTWALVADTNLQATYTIALEARDLADNKRRVFTTQPTGPYDIGDLWVKAGTTVGDVTTPQTINVAIANRTIGFLASEWELADEQAKDFIENTWEPESATIKNQIDGKIEYLFYESYTDITGATDEANALDLKDNEWNTQELKENAHGNIVYFKDTRNAYWYNSSIPEWLAVDNTDIYEALQDAAQAQGAADGKISQFYAWSGDNAPADYTAVIKEAVYSTDIYGNYLDSNGDITTDSQEYVEVEAEVQETISGDNVQYWFKDDNILYYRDTPSWTAVPTSSGTGDKYLSAGDLLTVFNPTDRDTTVYTFNGSTWDTTGPTSVISKSRFFTDLDNAVKGPNGIIATTANGIRLDSEAYTDDSVTTLSNSFAYNSTLKIGETYYNTGFGLDASAVTQDPNADGTSASTAYDSEFWVNAERFVLKSPSYPDIQAVFTVKSSGITLGTEYTEATKNEPKGVYDSGEAYDKGDVVSYNNSSYVAMVDMTVEQNEVPGTNPLKWQLLAAQGVSPVVYEFDGEDGWPTNTNEAGADEHVFDSLFAGNVVVRVLAYDAEGGVNISLNGGTAVPFTRTLGDNTEEWYQFSFDNLVVGSNTLRFWSTTGDGGSIKKVAVSFAGASGLNGGSVDFLFIRSASEPTLPPTNTNWETDVTQVAAGAGDLWSVKEVTPLGGGTVTYEGLRVIDAPIVREITIYSTPSASAVAKPTTSTYNFSTDSLTIDNTNWSRSVAGITTNGHKIYVSTALVTGNPTETAKAITWSEPSIYAQRQDGISPDALTVSSTKVGDTTTLTFSNGTIATVKDGALGSSVAAIYSNDALGTVQSLEQGTKEYVNYYEYSGTLTLPIPDLTFVKYVGEDGDSEGVIPVYADDANGAGATLEFSNQEFVNFYEWTGSAPTTAPAGLTYVKFVGEDGVSFTGTTEYYAKSSNGTTAPAIGTTDPWFTTPPTLDATNKYLWNYNVVSRSDGSSTNSTPTIITTYVKDGKGISSISEKYQSSNSGTVAPDGTWLETIPELDNTNRYLWNQTTIEYTEGDDTVIETLIAARGADGVSTDGTDGKSTALLTVYKRSATNITSAPTGGSFNFGTLAVTAPSTWSSTIPTGTDPVYASSGVASVTGTTGTDDSIAWGTPAKILENGTDGVGTDGKSLFEGLIFKRSSSPITTAPTGGSFNFGTNVLTPPSGWSIDIPTGTDPVYTSSGLFETTGDTGTDDTVAWSIPSKTFADGEDGVGIDGNSVYQFAIFKRSATPITTAPTGGSYNFTSNSATAPSGWSTTFPESDGNPLYQSTTIATISGATGTDSSLTWSTPSVLVQDGTNGTNGVDGNPGPRGTAVLSHSITDDSVDVDNITNSSIIAGYWTTAATADYAAEIAGDTLILTNTSQTANGGTHIYEYDGTNWASSTLFTINGNAVIDGTLSAAAVGAGYFTTTQLDSAPALTSEGTIMDSDGIKVYDATGQIRVKIGNLG
jgi:hypothetical protein